jgi:predicted negative regulator of RcsB-dependent stress response
VRAAAHFIFTDFYAPHPGASPLFTVTDFGGPVFRRFTFNRKTVVVGALVILSFFLMLNFASSYYSSQRNAAAQARLSQVITTFTNTANGRIGKEGYEQTIAQAKKIKDEYGSSPAGRLAQYYIALSEENLGQTANAIRDLQELIHGNDATMKALAQFALGSLYKNHGENEKALQVYKELDESGAYIKHSAPRENSESSSEHHSSGSTHAPDPKPEIHH